MEASSQCEGMYKRFQQALNSPLLLLWSVEPLEASSVPFSGRLCENSATLWGSLAPDRPQIWHSWSPRVMERRGFLSLYLSSICMESFIRCPITMILSSQNNCYKISWLCWVKRGWEVGSVWENMFCPLDKALQGPSGSSKGTMGPRIKSWSSKCPTKERHKGGGRNLLVSRIFLLVERIGSVETVPGKHK